MGRAGPASTAPLYAVALFFVIAAGFAQGLTTTWGAASVAPSLVLRSGAGLEVAEQGRVLLPSLALRRCMQQLHLRGGDDEEEEGAGSAEDKEDGEDGGDGEGGNSDANDDPDSGPMTITKAIRQVRHRVLHVFVILPRPPSLI